MSKAGKGKIRLAVIVVAVIAVLAGGVFALNIPGFGKHEKVKAQNGAVSLPLSAVADGKAHFYRFADGGKNLDFFIVKGSDGAVRTAFDACDVCFREKKGYEQQGDVMICRNCNRKFAIDRIGPHSIGGCNPSYLPNSQAGGKVVFSVADLKAGARFF